MCKQSVKKRAKPYLYQVCLALAQCQDTSAYLEINCYMIRDIFSSGFLCENFALYAENL